MWKNGFESQNRITYTDEVEYKSEESHTKAFESTPVALPFFSPTSFLAIMTGVGFFLRKFIVRSFFSNSLRSSASCSSINLLSFLSSLVNV